MGSTASDVLGRGLRGVTTHNASPRTVTRSLLFSLLVPVTPIHQHDLILRTRVRRVPELSPSREFAPSTARARTNGRTKKDARDASSTRHRHRRRGDVVVGVDGVGNRHR